MHTASTSLTEKEDREQSIDEQDIFCRVVFFLAALNLLYLSLLTPVASPNPLLYQSLPTSIHDRHAIGRRRKDDTHVGTAARGIVV